MIPNVYQIEFLTPCFCAGADQKRAELRPSSIRGQLRWWFRCLGGSQAEEKEAFGGVHGDKAKASSFSIRAQVQPGGGQRDWYQRIPDQGTTPRAYLLGFFCGRTGRLEMNGALPPDSKATVQLLFHSPPSDQLQRAIRVFFSIGALGFRATRAAGAFTCREMELTSQKWTELENELRGANFTVELLPEHFSDWTRLIDFAGDLLKNRLRSRHGLAIGAGQNGSRANALGSAEPRQGSALHFRPVRIDGALRLALIEAPHPRVLGKQARDAHRNRRPVIELARSAGLIGSSD